MVNFSQRPKRQVEIFIELVPETPVEKIREFISEAQVMLQTLHSGLTSHRQNLVDLQGDVDDTERSFFVAMDELYKVRVYSYTEELDPKKHALIKSEVWLALAEIMEDLGLEMQSSSSQVLENTFVDDETPFATELSAFGIH